MDNATEARRLMKLYKENRTAPGIVTYHKATQLDLGYYLVRVPGAVVRFTNQNGRLLYAGERQEE